MNINKFTQKSIEAIQNTEKLAYEYGNPQMDEEHFLLALLRLEESLIAKLLTKMDISPEMFTGETEKAVAKLKEA